MIAKIHELNLADVKDVAGGRDTPMAGSTMESSALVVKPTYITGLPTRVQYLNTSPGLAARMQLI